MKRYLAWWALYGLCNVAALLLMPLAMAMVWITQLVARGQDRAYMELLRARAAGKNNRSRKRSRRWPTRHS